MFEKWNADIDAIMERDPAARTRLEVVLCYPSFKAVRRHRRAHWYWMRGYKLIARLISQRTRRKTGIEIHPGAKIGPGLFIDHGMGVVIGETAEIGEGVTIYQGVTLGGTGKDSGKRHPNIGNHVVIGAGARVLGPFTVGDYAKIGASAVVLKEVPPHSTVVGNPGRVVKLYDKKVDDLDQVHLPDPIKECMVELCGRVNRVEKCMRAHVGEGECGCGCEDLEDCIRIEREVILLEDL